MFKRAALLGTTLLAACGSFPTWDNPFAAAPVAVLIDQRNADSPIVIARNQTLVVTLEANITTGYRWEAVSGYSPILIGLPTPDYSARPGATPVIGAPGDMTFKFRGENAGTTALAFVYRRPFEPDAAPAKTIRYDVTVR